MPLRRARPPGWRRAARKARRRRLPDPPLFCFLFCGPLCRCRPAPARAHPHALPMSSSMCRKQHAGARETSCGAASCGKRQRRCGCRRGSHGRRFSPGRRKWPLGQDLLPPHCGGLYEEPLRAENASCGAQRSRPLCLAARRQLRPVGKRGRRLSARRISPSGHQGGGKGGPEGGKGERAKWPVGAHLLVAALLT